MAIGERLSVVIPSWREGPRLLDTLRAARTALGDCEAVVVASEETDDVREVACAEGAQWIESPRPCRGLQLRMGAGAARGEHVLFLHADSRLPADAGRYVRSALAMPGVSGGAFRLRFDRSHVVLSVLGWLSALAIPTAFLGDQCLFCTKQAYTAAGGFSDQPLFEDVDLARRLARVGRLVRLPQTVTTSARRFTEVGPFRQVLTNAFLMGAFHAGVSPDRLHARYTRHATGRLPVGLRTPK